MCRVSWMSRQPGCRQEQIVAREPCPIRTRQCLSPERPGGRAAGRSDHPPHAPAGGELRALTHSPSSHAAQALARQGVEVMRGGQGAIDMPPSGRACADPQR
jgi:hypothetical protein